MTQEPQQQATLFGHPTGLYTLFFAEMWERFSYYGMRALLVFYMIKGFLGYGDSDAYAVYGAYTALVYMTPFFGGMLADRLLGARRAVVLGGLLMAAGHLMMTIESETFFFGALALIICGNGFFKPNISTMVGSLYPEGSPKRDSGFTIFYIGINLGASMAPLLCGYIGENYGWHYGFGLATGGMLTGLAVFVMPVLWTQIMVGLGAATAAFGLFWYMPNNVYNVAINIFVGVALLVAGVVALVALDRGGLPKEAGAPPDPERLRAKSLLGIPNALLVYLSTFVMVPVFAMFVCGFGPFTSDNQPLTLISAEYIESLATSESAWAQIFAVVVEEVSKPAGLVLVLAGLIAVVYLGIETFKQTKVKRERMFVVLILTFFSMLFWSFFEQAGSSVNNFTDRNVDRVTETRVVTEADVGQTVTIQPTQEQLGYAFDGADFTLTHLDDLRAANEEAPEFTVDWPVTADHVGMKIGSRNDETPASTFQAVNPVFILIFGLVFTALWAFLAARKFEPSTPFKFALGILQLGLGFGAFWYGAQMSDERGMVALEWLFLGYMLQTTGELCLSPVGLSMVTKLSPGYLVSTVMGTWFLATAFSQYLAAIISQFTGVGHGGDGEGALPVPRETVHVYGDVFGQISVAAMISAGVLFLLTPLLRYWMHEEAPADT